MAVIFAQEYFGAKDTASVSIGLIGSDNQPINELLEGLTNFLDVIADQLHDRYGIPCLLEEDSGEEEKTEEEGEEARHSDDGGHASPPNDMG